ncbi:MAG: helix-turn-helix domain-containing protein [Acidimicrobiaceae bacterium]|nr:helix-turn-helix domain-containing protein [Acidimicrobiaceae bacterium]
MNLELFTQRAKVHAALGDPLRLAIADQLTLCDRAPSELAATLEIESNLLAHHLAALESVGLIERLTSQGDRRRRYIRLRPEGHRILQRSDPIAVRRIVFICTENAARSQLAEGIWKQSHPLQAISGGTRPTDRLHPGTVQAAARRGIDLTHAVPSPIPDLEPDDLIVTVCDRAHEELPPGPGRLLHWSLPDPAASTEPDAYDAAADSLAARIDALLPSIEPRASNESSSH